MTLSEIQLHTKRYAKQVRRRMVLDGIIRRKKNIFNGPRVRIPFIDNMLFQGRVKETIKVPVREAPKAAKVGLMGKIKSIFSRRKV